MLSRRIATQDRDFELEPAIGPEPCSIVCPWNRVPARTEKETETWINASPKKEKYRRDGEMASTPGERNGGRMRLKLPLIESWNFG